MEKPKAKKENARKKEDARYFEGLGRRKTAVARVRLFEGAAVRGKTKGKTADIIVNAQDYRSYFPAGEIRSLAEESLRKTKCLNRFKIEARIKGGGIHSQAEALRHGIARALIKFNPDFRKRLKRVGLLKRDPRMKERKKFGLKKARRAPQWSKR
jgi:small subunit ribosomal protein S9